MTVNGKAKVDFEKWYGVNVEFVGEVLYLEEFYILPGSMKYGVYVDWFDSVGIHIEINFRSWENSWQFELGTNDNNPNYRHFSINTRPEARTAAITKATELYNNRK